MGKVNHCYQNCFVLHNNNGKEQTRITRDKVPCKQYHGGGWAKFAYELPGNKAGGR